MTTPTRGQRPLKLVASCLLVSGLLTFLGALASEFEAVRYLLIVVTVVLWANAAMVWAADRQAQAPAPSAPRDDWSE